MANRNDELYGYYLMAHIYSGGNCGDIAPQQMGRQSYPSADVRGNDAKAAVALGQMHGRAGTEALSMERLVATVEGMVAWDPERTSDPTSGNAELKDTDRDPGKNITIDDLTRAVRVARSGPTGTPNAGDLADMKAATQGLGVVTEKVVERVVTEAGVAEQTTHFPLLDPPNMGDVWVPRLGGPPIPLMFFDPTCGSFGGGRTGYGDQDWITTNALRELYRRKFVAICGCSWVSAAATWAAVRAKVTYPARVSDLVVAALGENAKMPEIKAAVAALALAEKSAKAAQ